MIASSFAFIAEVSRDWALLRTKTMRNVTIVVPPGSTRYNVSASTDGGNVSYPDGLASSSSRNMITVNSGGGDVSITQGPAGLSAP